MVKKRLLRIPILFAGGLVVALAGFYPGKETPQFAPDVTFQLIDGRKVPLRERTGHPSLIVFWATSCHSCLQEIPHFSQLYRDLATSGFEIIAVAMPYDRPDHVVEMQKARNIPYPIALDIQGKIVSAFGHIKVTPSSFLIDSSGRVVKHHIGLWDMAELAALVKVMLKKS